MKKYLSVPINFLIVLYAMNGCSNEFTGGGDRLRGGSSNSQGPNQTHQNIDNGGDYNGSDPYSQFNPGQNSNGPGSQSQDGNGQFGPNGSLYGGLGDDDLRVTECIEGDDKVTNGDFENGNQAFTSDYTFQSGCGDLVPHPALHYTINTGPKDCHVNYFNDSGDDGKLLVVNMPAAGQGEKKFWCQDIDVEKGQRYQISVRLRVAANNGQKSIVEWTIDDDLFTRQFDPTTVWDKFLEPWTAEKTGKVKLCGRAITQNAESGDLVVDDIFFREC